MTVQDAPDDWTPHFVCHHLDGEENQQAMLRTAYSLRHQVYCLECHFLSADDYPEGLERDQFDTHCAHFSANNLLNEMVGYVRLVTARENVLFPFEEHCQNFLPQSEQPLRHETGEISRLIVRRDYRRRTGDNLAGVTIQTVKPGGQEVVQDRRKPPQILLGLYRQMYIYSIQSGIRYWYAAMEKPLARALSQLGFRFVQISPEIDYYGNVVCYLADLRQLEAHLQQSNPELLSWFRQGIS